MVEGKNSLCAIQNKRQKNYKKKWGRGDIHVASNNKRRPGLSVKQETSTVSKLSLFSEPFYLSVTETSVRQEESRSDVFLFPQLFTVLPGLEVPSEI